VRLGGGVEEVALRGELPAIKRSVRTLVRFVKLMILFNIIKITELGRRI
jgi:hypothetical protein